MISGSKFILPLAVFLALAQSALAQPKFLEYYSGQTVEELISMQQTHRTDSLVLAFESAIQQKAERDGVELLSEPERTVLAVEALEREVNNGGFYQFFMNSSKEQAPVIVDALERINCPKTAHVARQAIDQLGISGEPMPSAIDMAMGTFSDDSFSKFDEEYFYAGEPIAERLFEYIKRNKGQISF